MTEKFMNCKTAVDALRRIIPDVGDEFDASMEVGAALLAMAEHTSAGDQTSTDLWNGLIYEIHKLCAGTDDLGMEPEQLRGFHPVGCTHEDGGGLCPRHGQFESGGCPVCSGGKENEQKIVIKFETEPCSTRQCPLCGQGFYMAAMTWAYLEGTTDPVCLDCAGPELAGLLAAKRMQAAQIYEAMDTIKAAKIEHYKDRGPVLFCQVDAFVDCGADDVVKPGPDGVAVTGNMKTWELMHGSTVRVLIRADATMEEAKRGFASIQRAIAGGFINRALEKDEAAEALEHAEVLRQNNGEGLPF